MIEQRRARFETNAHARAIDLRQNVIRKVLFEVLRRWAAPLLYRLRPVPCARVDRVGFSGADHDVSWVAPIRDEIEIERLVGRVSEQRSDALELFRQRTLATEPAGRSDSVRESLHGGRAQRRPDHPARAVRHPTEVTTRTFPIRVSPIPAEQHVATVTR